MTYNKYVHVSNWAAHCFAIVYHLLELLHPCLHPPEAVSICDIKDEQRSLSITVVYGTQCMEALLPCCVPDGKLQLQSYRK